MAAAYAGIALEPVPVETSNPPAELLNANPLGKIPVLIADDGATIFDSRAITQYLNRQSGNKLFPRNPAKRTDAERLEALADGIADCALAHVYERRSRPEEIVHQPWLDKQWAKVDQRARRAQRQPAETRQEDQWRAYRVARHARLSRPALCRKMGEGPGQAEALGGALRREIPGVEGTAAGLTCAAARRLKQNRAPKRPVCRSGNSGSELHAEAEGDAMVLVA